MVYPCTPQFYCIKMGLKGVHVFLMDGMLDVGSARYEPSHGKTNNVGSRPGLTQTGRYGHRSLEFQI